VRKKVPAAIRRLTSEMIVDRLMVEGLSAGMASPNNGRYMLIVVILGSKRF
jgi:hypothetical protein